MRKYAEACPPDARPDLRFDLPVLQYPARLNAVEEVLEGARRNGWSERTAFYAGGRAVSFAEVAAEVHRYAAGLRALGLGPGDAVLLRIPDTLELVCALLAVQAIGGVAVPTYVQLRAADLTYRAEDADARLLLCTPELLAEAAPVADARGGQTEIVALPRDPSGRFRAFADVVPDIDVPPTYADTDAEEIALILYTSGSTGQPKGACHCHRDMLAVADTFWRGACAPRPDDVLAGPASVAFALGYGMFTYFPLRLGHAAVLQPDKSPETALADIGRYGVTIFAAVVSYFIPLTRLIAERKADVSSLRRVMAGGEPMAEEVERAWLAATGLPMEQFIGTTETLHIFAASTHPTEPPRPATMGRAVPGYETAVLDPDSHAPVPPGTQGLLAVRGPTGTVYWNKPDRQREVVIDGWNVFQDIVWADEGGDLHYVARHDEMIVSAGYNISPVQVEEVLLRHDAVAECACVPAPDPSGRRGAIVKAFVVPAAGVVGDDALKAALQDWVKANAPPYIYPRDIAFEAELPKTVNGKILRAELRKRAAAAQRG